MDEVAEPWGFKRPLALLSDGFENGDLNRERY
jgi:hypothetical protein